MRVRSGPISTKQVIPSASNVRTPSQYRTGSRMCRLPAVSVSQIVVTGERPGEVVGERQGRIADRDLLDQLLEPVEHGIDEA